MISRLFSEEVTQAVAALPGWAMMRIGVLCTAHFASSISSRPSAS